MALTGFYLNVKKRMRWGLRDDISKGKIIINMVIMYIVYFVSQYYNHMKETFVL